jgi:hypothetical protein
MSTKTNSEKRKFKRLAAEQEKNRELFSAKMRQENMEMAFGYGLVLAGLLEKIWFQHCCKLSLYNPDHVIYFSMTSCFFFFIIGWIIAGEFKCKKGLANFSFLSGFSIFTLVYMLFQVNSYQIAQIATELALACTIGVVLSLSYRRLKAIIRSLPRCFSHSPSP